jgi:hypothetical protein
MKKKSKNLAVLVILIVISLGSWAYYKEATVDAPISTGGDVMLIVPENIEDEPNAMERLSKELPLKTNGLSIEYSFKKGKYIVESNGSSNLQGDFDAWYESSDFKAIPKTRFLITP